MGVTVVFPGTFDPITYGHIDLVTRAQKLYERVIVAVATNTNKTSTFPLAERITMAQDALVDLPQVQVVSFSGLLIEFVRHQKAQVVVRGLRALSDFEYEFQLANMNRELDERFETVFLMPALKYAFLSSSLVREVAELGGNVAAFVPPVVAKALTQHFTHTHEAGSHKH